MSRSLIRQVYRPMGLRKRDLCKAYRYIESIVGSWTDEERAEMFIVGIPKALKEAR